MTKMKYEEYTGASYLSPNDSYNKRTSHDTTVCWTLAESGALMT